MVTFVKEFENYILSNNNEETLSTLVSGSQSEIYIQLINKLKEIDTLDKKLNPEIWNILKKLKERVSSQVYESSKLIIMLKEYDLKETTKERKEEILNEIKTSYYSYINFNHSKPSHIQKNLTHSDDSNKLGDTLDENILSLKSILDKWYDHKSSDELSWLPVINENAILSVVDLMAISDKLLIELVQNTSLNYYDLGDKVLERIAGLVNAACEKDKGLTLNLHSLLSMLTYKQIEYLTQAITSTYFDKNTLVNSYINKKFTSKLQAAKDDYKKRSILHQIYHYISKQDSSFAGYKANLLLQILENGAKIKQYDLELFKEYLKNPVSVNDCYNLKKEQVKTISKQQRWNICGENYVSNDKSIISTYLKHFFTFEGVEMVAFGEYLGHDFLKRHYYEALVLRGEETETIIEYIGQSTYESIVKKTEITICNHNKPSFAVDEPVILEVDIKNIQTLFIKIFEINTENYYYNKKSAINTAMSLEGLITTYEETYSFNEKPQKVIRRQIELEKIPKRRGLYIIEMIGSGYSSRAIIKKGSLSLVSGPAPKGKVFFIVDENSQVCNSKSTGIWFKNTFYTPDATNGGITIPYMKQSVNDNAILVHESFAELANVTVSEEVYRLSGYFHFNHESLIMGNTTKILVKPYLTINDREAKLDYLKNISVNVSMLKLENDISIPISNVFDNLVCSNDKDIEVEIQIPPKLTALEFSFNAEVYNYSKETKQTLSFKQSVQLNSQNEDFDIIRQYLRKVGNNYVICVLGKNGEPKQDMALSLTFNHKQLQQPITHSLQTNGNGEVILGKLSDVNSLTSTTYYVTRPIIYSWEIPKEREFSYPTSLDILTTESVVLPFDGVDKTKLSLVKVSPSTGEVIEDCLDKVALNPTIENSNRLNINISGLSEGTYVLGFKSSNQFISLSVHEGSVWKSNNFYIVKDKIIENAEFKHPIQINEFKVQDNKISIKVDSKSSKQRVNVFLYQFLHFETSSIIKKHKNIIQNFNQKSFHNFQTWKNFYLSNRLLNEEIQYVFDRKYFERFIGNSLERPSLLMKRQFIRDTTTDNENVNQGTEYAPQQAEILQSSMPSTSQQYMAYDAPMSMRARNYSDQQMQQKQVIRPTNLYSNFHNFLAYSPVMLLNLIPDENGEVVIDNIDLSGYSHIHIIAVDEKSITEENHNLNNPVFSKRSLALTMPLEAEKTYSELRLTDTILKEKSVTIADITSTKFKLLDSMDKFISFASIVNSGLNSEWSKYNFLLKLNELSEEEKKKKLSNVFSHEVNLFIYFKYPQLFEKYVKPVLRYKAEKTFVDFFLMNDLANLNKFCTAERLNTLNAIEKCLLLYSVRKENTKFAENIHNLILTNSENTKVKPDELKRLFNILMNMKVEESEQLKNITEQTVNFSLMDMVPSSCYVGGGGMRKLCKKKMSVPKMEEKCFKRKEISDEEDECMEGDIFDYGEEEDAYHRNAKNNLFREAGKSKEFCETHWRTLNFDKNQIPDNFFWSDLANYWLSNKELTLSKDFLSKNILFQINNISELLCIIAVLDLPLQPVSHQFNRKEGRALEIIAKSNLMLFTKEIAETESQINSNLMIAQNITEYNQTNSETQISEFIINKIYIHETIVTNISSQNITFELLVQIPEGSMPVMNSEYTKTINQSLSRFNTVNYKTYFYFPEIGIFKQYPPNIAVNGVVISKSQMLTYNVVSSATIQSKESLDNVLEMGSKDDILEFIKSQTTIKQADLNKILWLLKEKDFYSRLIEILRSRAIFNQTIWGFGFYHKDETAIKELLLQNDSLRQIVGPNFKSSILSTDETNNADILKHLDYHPIINARVHRLGQENKLTILNRELKETYQQFIVYLISLKHINSKNWLRLSYYLILQDRIEDAIKAFQKIDLKEFTDFYSLQIQYDYIAAYLDFSCGYPDFAVAKNICKKYKDFPLTQ
jgi:hypothetical protein